MYLSPDTSDTDSYLDTAGANFLKKYPGESLAIPSSKSRYPPSQKLQPHVM